MELLMSLLTLLILLPIIVGAAIYFVKPQKLFSALVRATSFAVIALSLLFAVFYRQGAEIVTASARESGTVFFIETAVALFIIISAVRAGKYPLLLLALAQTALLSWYKFGPARNITAAPTFIIDDLALFMVLIVGIVGALICLFAVKYMKDYHARHPEIADRRGLFFSVLFIFTGAMFGLVLANDMALILLFWEITTLASFLLIGYSRTKEAVDNAFLALTVNVFGGLLFTAGIVIAATLLNIGDLRSLAAAGGGNIAAVTAVFLLACAGLIKSAQMPFSKWLLGAMVAPTPVSAILHSATMVKAGVYLIIRLAPMLGLNAAGVTITLAGGITFLIAAIIAISQTDTKKILAYSTISNLGLIITCAGLNTPASIWAAMMLIVFHAVTKSLLFLTVGATEHCIGSRDAEKMDGFYKTSPALAMLMITGIAGMFVAPFGMLISKWAAMKAFADYGNPLVSTALLLIIAYGSTVTFFYWIKWLGKLIADTTLYKPDTFTYKMGADEKISLYLHAAMVVLLCVIFPLVSKYFIMPYTAGVYAETASIIDRWDIALTLSVMLIFFILTVVSIPLYRRYKGLRGSVYMSGLNTGDNRSYHGSIGQTVTVRLSNRYLTDIFGEKLWFGKTQVVSAALLLVGFMSILKGWVL
jgi:ech hydrogenase subunit A